MANISSLYTSLSGLQAQRKVMDLTGHNIANASTPGFHRQRAELQSLGGTTTGLFSGAGRKFGVDVIGVTRSFDNLIEARAVREEAGKAAADLTSATLSRIEGLFPEPSDDGLAAQFDAFWGAWTDVANEPDGLAARTQLLQTAGDLASSLQRSAAQLATERNGAIDRLVGVATDTNDLAGQIASLNKAIVANPTASMDLLDQRDTLVRSLATLTGATSRPGTGGQIDVYIGGRAIVSGPESFDLNVSGGVLRFAVDGQAVAAPAGQAAALAATINDIIPRYTAALDDVAATLVGQVNAVHTAGYDQGGTTGRNFFDPAGVTAATVVLSTDVLGQPANIAAGAPAPGPPGALDGDQARAIAALADSATGADSKYRALISGLAVETGAAARRADLQEQLANSAQSEADAIGAVSLDEEMANLTAAQRAFEASARVLTAIDDMLGTLIERTGVVGR